MEGKRTKEAEGPLITESSKISQDFVFKGKPDFVKQRYLSDHAGLSFSPTSKSASTRSTKNSKNLKSPSL